MIISSFIMVYKRLLPGIYLGLTLLTSLSPERIIPLNLVAPRTEKRRVAVFLGILVTRHTLVLNPPSKAGMMTESTIALELLAKTSLIRSALGMSGKCICPQLLMPIPYIEHASLASQSPESALPLSTTP